jgi:hypothetical protein
LIESGFNKSKYDFLNLKTFGNCAVTKDNETRALLKDYYDATKHWRESTLREVHDEFVKSGNVVFLAVELILKENYDHFKLEYKLAAEKNDVDQEMNEARERFFDDRNGTSLLQDMTGKKLLDDHGDLIRWEPNDIANEIVDIVEAEEAEAKRRADAEEAEERRKATKSK